MEQGAEYAIHQAHAPSEQNHLDALRDDVLEEVLEYAYENDLIKDYRLESFSLSHLFGKLIRSTIPITTDNGFTDCTHLTALELPNPTPRGEKLNVTDSALRLNCEARRELPTEEVNILTQEVCNDGHSRSLKLELPVLRTDNEWDMKEFQKEMLVRQNAHEGDHRIPFEPIDVAAGEGLELPAEVRLETEVFLTKLEGEKLGVTKESARYLVGSLGAEVTKEDRKSFVQGQMIDFEYRKNSVTEELELPISPKLIQGYTVPRSDACLIPIPSDPSSSILSDDLKAAEAYLFEDMEILDAPTSPTLDKFLKNSSPRIEIEPGKGRLSNHKIEMPLLSGLSPVKPELSGPDAFNKFVGKEIDIDNELKEAGLENFPSDDLEDQFGAMAEQSMKSIEQEQLQAADAIARVPVPVMDFSIPETEWTRLRKSASAVFKWIQGGHEDIFNLPKWPRDMLTESRLIWRPVKPGVDPVPIPESIEASEALVQSFIDAQDEQDIPNSSDFVQKRDDLLVLGTEDEGDEIEPLLTNIKPRTDLVAVVRKRGLNIVDTTSKRQRISGKRPFVNQTSGSDRATKALTETQRDRKDQETQALLQESSFRGPGDLLEQYTKLCAPQKMTASKYFPSKETKKAEVAVLPSPPESSERDCRDTSRNPVEPKATISPKPVSRAPHPSINLPPTPPTVFISLSIARFLISALDRLIPEMNLIERDYRAHNTSVWSPGSVSRAEVVPPLAHDADITVSPITGLIITTMILIRQKPRPGLSKNGFQERVEKVSARYERVVILVGGDGGVDDTLREVTASDSTALTELQGFTSGLECKVMVYYVGGGDDTLSRWVASMVCRYAQTDHPQIQKGLLEAETLWELFLRRAGFNVYAAQAVAAQLKVPSSGEDDTSSSRHGLAAFVTMTRAERRQRFGHLVGLRVLERVSRIVDEIWNKA
ncbi:hypothetical protein VMCG_09236 [Cytospora schulzeri]|uniref:Uncharacterized protein n=1 Tax=Cytospora schulzeri TaxID=448051 RepID=A0A423VKY8_9PEZI|nr:hypothetical protein VMCG_09236 [Valsa malicola]